MVSGGVSSECLSRVNINNNNNLKYLFMHYLFFLQILQQPNRESTDVQPTTSSVAPESGDGIPSALQALFPGEPLPPGTELLLGLPPPPPPPLPADEIPSTTDDAYVCAEDSSDESGTKDDDQREPKAEAQTIDPEIDGEEMVEEEEGGGEEVPLVVDDPAVISRPPQLRFPVVSSSASLLSAPSSSSLSVPAMGRSAFLFAF